ncbi:hypothetical protein TGAM01_v209917 [Trichoderma gamsii]|uniref:Uncharacterized protein n=1 Tax=Trichoderma gamsii TaxID=398673 RepID=A0A2P4ZAC9_9HYPO|nr:hypothetical protein TGAM01_v209917 [Trichoderma gamsii]PON21191.1 hypothetical protein TGAM01_v209917 [Trichoderma gamsii]
MSTQSRNTASQTGRFSRASPGIHDKWRDRVLAAAGEQEEALYKHAWSLPEDLSDLESHGLRARSWLIVAASCPLLHEHVPPPVQFLVIPANDLASNGVEILIITPKLIDADTSF